MNTKSSKNKSSKKPIEKNGTNKSFVLTKKNQKAVVDKKTLVQKSENSATKFYLTIGLLFLVAGGLLAYQPLMRHWDEGKLKTTAPAPAPERTPEIEANTKINQMIQGKPVRLVVASLNIDVKVADGVYNSKSQTWTLSKDKAHYALMTPEPNNQEGNTFIYGHNRPEVFARLSKLAVGQDAVIYTDNNHVFTYRFRSAYETNPNDDSLFAYKGAPILTLQTCSGLWYQNRFLMTFDLVGAV